MVYGKRKLPAFNFLFIETYEAKVKLNPSHFGRLRIPLLFTFQRNGRSFKVLREIIYRCVPDAELFAEIEPVAPYEKPEIKLPEKREVVRSSVKASSK